MVSDVNLLLRLLLRVLLRCCCCWFDNDQYPRSKDVQPYLETKTKRMKDRKLASTLALVRVTVSRAVDIALLRHLDREWRWQGGNKSQRAREARRRSELLRERIRVKEAFRREWYAVAAASPEVWARCVVDGSRDTDDEGGATPRFGPARDHQQQQQQQQQQQSRRYLRRRRRRCSGDATQGGDELEEEEAELLLLARQIVAAARGLQTGNSRVHSACTREAIPSPRAHASTRFKQLLLARVAHSCSHVLPFLE